MKVFQIQKKIYEAICQQAEEEYPSEACGWIIEYKDGTQTYTPTENLQDKYHKLDPETYPRTSKDAFFMNTRKLEKAIEEAKEKGGRLFSIVHSHIDVGAYFSEEDKKQMSDENGPIFLADCYLVVGVTNKKVDSNAVFYYDYEKKDFIQAELEII
ncbi:MAG: hypothetical protein D6767_04830 [Candidatus Hydrogenedentota bacterium]|nr:MAG: hypothetical protein D6767_04830 [Candidatus Hydrogenedentota bacterium]